VEGAIRSRNCTRLSLGQRDWDPIKRKFSVIGREIGPSGMKTLLINQAQRAAAVLCLWLLFPLERGAAQFVELTAEIELNDWHYWFLEDGIALSAGRENTTSIFTKSLGLPRSVKLFTENNQPVFQYQVRQSTNVLGWNFPLEFYLVQYARPAPMGGSYN